MPPSANARICVYLATDPIEGNLIRGLLASSGIDAELTGEALAGAYPGIPLVSETRVFVAPRYRDQAKRIIEEYEARAAQDRHWTCGRCGERNTATFETCWQCQWHAPDEPEVRR